jgi:acetyl esterase/lipase
MNAMSAQQLGRVDVRTLDAGGAQGALAARLYADSVGTAKKDNLLVYFHGGGFNSGDLEDADEFMRHLVLHSPQLAVLSSTYTLAATAPFPAAVEDAHAVLAWANKHKAKLGWTGKRLLVGGMEAGANLAAVACMMARDRGAPPLAGQILIMPMLDPGLSSASMRAMPNCSGVASAMCGCEASYRDYLPNAADRSHPYASPLQSSRLKNLPPALILSADDDPLRDEAELYGNKLNACGVSTTVRRLAPVSLQNPDGRNECACRDSALDQISRYIDSLDGPAPT